MHGVHFLTVFMGGAVLLLITLGLIIIGIIRTAKGNGKLDPKSRSEETQMIQDMFNSLSRMEERVEALETILIERSRDRDSQFRDKEI